MFKWFKKYLFFPRRPLTPKNRTIKMDSTKGKLKERDVREAVKSVISKRIKERSENRIIKR